MKPPEKATAGSPPADRKSNRSCRQYISDSAAQRLNIPRCSHANTRVEHMQSGSHYAEEKCVDCGKHLRWFPRPETVERKRLNGFRLIKLGMCGQLTRWQRQDYGGVDRVLGAIQRLFDAISNLSAAGSLWIEQLRGCIETKHEMKKWNRVLERDR